MSMNQSGSFSERARTVLHIGPDGRKSTTVTRFVGDDGATSSSGASVARCPSGSPSAHARPWCHEELGQERARGRIATRQIEDPQLSELLGDSTLSLATELPCINAHSAFLHTGDSAALVVSPRVEVVGVLVYSDLCIYGARQTHSRAGVATTSRAVDHRQADAGERTVELPGVVCDLMRPCEFAVTGNTLLSEAAAIMADHELAWLPIVDSQGAGAGLLSAMNIVRWVAESGGELPRAGKAMTGGADLEAVRTGETR